MPNRVEGTVMAAGATTSHCRAPGKTMDEQGDLEPLRMGRPPRRARVDHEKDLGRKTHRVDRLTITASPIMMNLPHRAPQRHSSSSSKVISSGARMRCTTKDQLRVSNRG